jgi:hypothetical protein
MGSESLDGRVSALEAWTRGHDDICALRYSDLKGVVTWLVRGVFSLLVAIVAWLAIQLWNGEQARLYALERRATAPPAQGRANPAVAP